MLSAPVGVPDAKGVSVVGAIAEDSPLVVVRAFTFGVEVGDCDEAVDVPADEPTAFTIPVDDPAPKADDDPTARPDAFVIVPVAEYPLAALAPLASPRDALTENPAAELDPDALPVPILMMLKASGNAGLASKSKVSCAVRVSPSLVSTRHPITE